MSCYAEVGDPVTRTAFEIRKETIPDDVAAILILTCESRREVSFEDFYEHLKLLWREDWPSLDKAQALYDWIVDYAIAPQLARCDRLGEEIMNCGPFFEIGTLYDHGCSNRVRYPNLKVNVPVNGDILIYDKSKLSLKWASGTIAGQERIVPGWLLPDKQHFYPLAYCANVEQFPAWRVHPGDLLDNFKIGHNDPH